MNEQALKSRLRTIAHEKQIPFNECWKKLLFERFLARLSRSSYSGRFIFKGGFLLSYLINIGRETKDMDFLLTHLTVDKNRLQSAIDLIITEDLSDGFIFSAAKIDLFETTHKTYPGYRIMLSVEMGSMRDTIQIDIGVGDVVNPETFTLPLFHYQGKPLFEGEISLRVYPAEAIFAEKLETVISKGRINSRMKDYHDLLLLSREKKSMDADILQNTLLRTFSHRNTQLTAIMFDEKDLKVLQPFWTQHLQNLGLLAIELSLPEDISVVISEINSYLFPSTLPMENPSQLSAS